MTGNNREPFVGETLGAAAAQATRQSVITKYICIYHGQNTPSFLNILINYTSGRTCDLFIRYLHIFLYRQNYPKNIDERLMNKPTNTIEYIIYNF